jgi:hypothetical protein
MSNSLERFSRQLGLLNQDWFLINRVSVIGIGNLGTPLCLNLAKAGFREIYIYDPDIIESHNLPNQMYGEESLTRSKTAIMIDTMHQFSPAIHNYIGMKRKIRLIEPLMFESEIMIVLTDNIQSRIESFLLALLYKYKVKYNVRYFIEAGTHAHTSKIHVVDLNSIKQRNTYFESLLERHKAPSVDLPCTERSTFFYASFIASVITGYLRNLSVGEKVPFETWIDLKNSQVMQWEKVNSPKHKWSLQKMFLAYDDDYNPKRLRSLARIIKDESPFSQNRFEEVCSDVYRHTGDNPFTWFLFNYLNSIGRTKIFNNTLRVDIKNRRKRKDGDMDCSRCICTNCRKMDNCKDWPCQGSKGFVIRSCDKKGRLGRVVYCKNVLKKHESDDSFIINAMKNKKLTDFHKVIKKEIRKWSGFEV